MLKPDDPKQSKRFLEAAAKEAGADETAKGAERAFKAVVKPRDLRTAEAMKAAQEYADDQRAILKTLRKPDAKH